MIKVDSHRRDAITRLTEKLESYQFQSFIHTARVTQKFERSIKIDMVLMFPLIALSLRVIALCLSERALMRNNYNCNYKMVYSGT